ncbi:kinase-like protein [Trametes coccinea BRFM310]|uniref:Kinase-like protein n=1 Tax=Trametes coccinea (strain BRFM310) TaxID=1353009 RepID=A0A1Y2IQ81_TRAC3|nr:kinase-like protein [Trametes coccinea BRFM310]
MMVSVSTLTRPLQSYPQCQDCGSAGKMYRDELCGTCRNARAREATELNPVAQKAVQDMHAARSLATEYRGLNNAFRPASTSQPQVSSASQASLSLSASTIPTRRGQPPALVPFGLTPPPPITARSLSVTRTIAVIFNYVLSNKKDSRGSSLASTTRSYPHNANMEDIIQDYIDALNVDWEKRSMASLTREDVELRWTLNAQMPERNSEDGTLGHFYDVHQATDHRQMYFGSGTGTGPLKHYKGQVVQLSLLIDIARFDERTGYADAAASGAVPKRGKRGRTSPSTHDNNPVKKPRTQAPPLVSKWVPASTERQFGMPSQTAVTEVLLEFAQLHMNASGAFTASWAEQDVTIRKASIADVPFAAGKTKHVFALDIKINGQWEPHVAKRFFEVGKGPDKVTCEDNATLLELEARRLYYGRYFLEAFHERAEVTGTQDDISQGWDFSTVFLAREHLELEDSTTLKPSPASGLRDSWEELPFSEQDAGVIWMIEPRRSRQVKRWSGTMSHPTHVDKMGATLDAFVHFAYEYSKCSLVFADLQSSKGHLRPITDSAYASERARTSKGHVLFDIMTHSIASDTGIGDHGEDGISTFVSSHQCNALCTALALTEVSPDTHAATRHTQQKQHASKRVQKAIDDWSGSNSGSEPEKDDGELMPRLWKTSSSTRPETIAVDHQDPISSDED